MKTRKELVELSKQYFKNPEVNVMYATRDGNFFHESHSNYASSHAKSNPDLGAPEKITRAEFVKALPLKDWKLPELREHCIEQKYPEEDWGKLKQKDIVKYITDMVEKATVDA